MNYSANPENARRTAPVPGALFTAPLNGATPATAEAFASDWIAAWNGRDLERILSHYASDVEFSSPWVSRLMSPGQHTLRGAAVLRVYFGRALNAYADLHFGLRRVYVGAQTLLIEYRSVGNRLAAEMLQFDPAALVSRVWCHYAASEAELEEAAA